MGEAEEIELPDDGIDWAEGESFCGTTPKQTAYVRHYLLCDENQTEAARRAGYGGSDGSLRSLASQTHNSESVQRLLAWAAIKSGQLDDGCNLAALKKRMSAVMLSSNGPGAVQAARFLKEIIDLEEMERSQSGSGDPRATLLYISNISPVLAAIMARREGIRWEMPAKDLPKALREIEDMRAAVMLAAEQDAAAPAPNANGSAQHIGR